MKEVGEGEEDHNQAKEHLQGQEVPMVEDLEGSIQATLASQATKEDQATGDRAPQDPSTEVATQATPATQDSNDTPATQGTIRVTRLDTLDTLRNREVRGQGLVFLPRVSREAPTDPLRPPLTAPHPLQTPLTTGPRHQPQRPPKDHQGQIAVPPRAVQGPHLLQVSMRVPQLPPGRLPSTPSRVTRQGQEVSRHQGPRKRREATTAALSLARKG